MCWRDVSSNNNSLSSSVSLPKATHYCLVQLLQMHGDDLMHIANHYKKIQWKQPRRLAGAHQLRTSRLPGLAWRLRLSMTWGRDMKCFRDYACLFLWGKSQYFSSYLIIEHSGAFHPVTLWGAGLSLGPSHPRGSHPTCKLFTSYYRPGSVSKVCTRNSTIMIPQQNYTRLTNQKCDLP